jgi:hypothetical protein
MCLNINLLELKLDPLTTLTVYRRPYESSSQLDEIREQLELGQFAARLGDRIWGYSLPEPVVEQYEFKQATHLAVALEPRFMNSLLRYAIRQRLEQLGFQRVGYDRFERPGDIAFALGEADELVAWSRWLVRPFSLPNNDSNVFTLFINPRLAYKFKISFAQLSGVGFHWSYFGDKVRAVTMEQASQGNNLWEVAHTALVIEDRGINGLLCKWRDGEKQEVSLAQCWPIASTQNRYHYLKRRYSGFRGEQLAKKMKAKDDDFFALKNVAPRIKHLGEQIGSLESGGGLKIQVGDFLELTELDRQVADELQSSLLLGEPEDVLLEEFVDEADEEEDLEEYVQLELF